MPRKLYAQSQELKRDISNSESLLWITQHNLQTRNLGQVLNIMK